MSDLSLVQVEGWTLAAGGFADGAPRVRDLELAEHLGYERAAKIRDLISRLVVGGKLCGSEVLTTVGKTSPGGGRPGREFWLTEAQALKVVAKSETSIADAILDELIRVFLLLRDQRQSTPGEDVLKQLEQRFATLLAPVLETMATVAKTVAAISGATIPPLEATLLKDDVRIIARMHVAAGVAKNENSARRRIYNRLSGALGWFGTGRNWKALPLHKLPDAKVLLAEMKREAEAMGPPPEERQLKLVK